MIWIIIAFLLGGLFGFILAAIIFASVKEEEDEERRRLERENRCLKIELDVQKAIVAMGKEQEQCKHSKYDGECDESDFDCETCKKKCPCATCRNENKWEWRGSGKEGPKSGELSNYCPNCGAKMDGKDDDNEKNSHS